jgi:hypothetical protein
MLFGAGRSKGASEGVKYGKTPKHVAVEAAELGYRLKRVPACKKP